MSTGNINTARSTPMYLHLIPSASRFDYLIFDGAFCYRESYRRGDFPPIEDTITQFIRFLQEHSLTDRV
ncbi:MAG: hypothetical protein ACLU9S_01425 [Oscillospiraceae bacterium]